LPDFHEYSGQTLILLTSLNLNHSGKQNDPVFWNSLQDLMKF